MSTSLLMQKERTYRHTHSYRSENKRDGRAGEGKGGRWCFSSKYHFLSPFVFSNCFRSLNKAGVNRKIATASSIHTNRNRLKSRAIMLEANIMLHGKALHRETPGSGASMQIITHSLSGVFEFKFAETLGGATIFL